jgi:hypothetical protein
MEFEEYEFTTSQKVSYQNREVLTVVKPSGFKLNGVLHIACSDSSGIIDYYSTDLLKPIKNPIAWDLLEINTDFDGIEDEHIGWAGF